MLAWSRVVMVDTGRGGHVVSVLQADLTGLTFKERRHEKDKINRANQTRMSLNLWLEHLGIVSR